MGGSPAFEEIALKFIDLGNGIGVGGGDLLPAPAAPAPTSGSWRGTGKQDALALFLSTKLAVLGRSPDRAQATMVGRWRHLILNVSP